MTKIINMQQATSAQDSAAPRQPEISIIEQQQQPQQQQQQWMLVATQTTNDVRQRMSMASDQLGHSLRQLYASASSIADLPPSYHNIPGIVPYFHGCASGPPPSYDDVVNPHAPPPSYQSLFGQMREARKSSSGLMDLLRRLIIILLSTLGCTLIIAFLIIIPFTMIIVGAVYIDECRVEHIPAFLLVGGLVWAFKNIVHCYAQCQSDDAQQAAADNADATSSASSTSGSNWRQLDPELATTSTNDAIQSTTRFQPMSRQLRARPLKSYIAESLLNCLLFGWFIAGCVIVFRNYKVDFEDESSARYCNRIVYLYMYWLITSTLLVACLFVACICCLMVSSVVASRDIDDLT